MGDKLPQRQQGRKRLPREQRRAVIEDAAAGLFAERGYAATRLQDVATAAGVTKQLLARHFATKRELHLALLVKHRDELVARIGAGMASPVPLAERIRRTTDAWFAYVEDHPYAARLLFKDTTGDPTVAAFHTELQASAREATAAALRATPELEIPEEHVEVVSEAIRAATVGIALWWADHPEVSRATTVDVAATLFERAFAAPPSPPGPP